MPLPTTTATTTTRESTTTTSATTTTTTTTSTTTTTKPTTVTRKPILATLVTRQFVPPAEDVNAMALQHYRTLPPELLKPRDDYVPHDEFVPPDQQNMDPLRAAASSTGAGDDDYTLPLVVLCFCGFVTVIALLVLIYERDYQLMRE